MRRKGFGITFEFTSPHTPQFNGRAERKFATIFNGVRACLNAAQLPKWLCQYLWAECGSHVAKIQNVLLRANQEKPAVMGLLEGELPGWRHVRPFGEVGIVSYSHDHNKMQSKLKNKARPCLVLSISSDRPAGTFRLYDIGTRAVINSRDVRWMGKYYGDFMQLPEMERSFLMPENEPSSDESSVSSLQSGSALQDYLRKQHQMQQEAKSEGIPRTNDCGSTKWCLSHTCYTWPKCPKLDISCCFCRSTCTPNLTNCNLGNDNGGVIKSL